MSERTYVASLSRSQGREGYSILFRHPARRDVATGKTGVRVRRGLGTRERTEAERLCSQLNELLGESTYHTAAARGEAERRFDPRVVDIFYDKMSLEAFDFAEAREIAIPLPDSSKDDYRRVLLLGTTGAGKTTLVRQLIGTDPRSERFPSTSTAKTTVHDTEILFDDGPWRAVVTFVSVDELREYLNECVSAAVLAAWRGADDAEILRRLLNHVNQRFRFNYVLGNGPVTPSTDFDDDDEVDEEQSEPGFPGADDTGEIDLATTNALLVRSVACLREIAQRLGDRLRKDLEASELTDERVLDELFEDQLDNLLREEEAAHQVCDDLLDEIESRFNFLSDGEISRNKQGWPLAWKGRWGVEERGEFIRAISRFSSNYAPLFGRLLTPLVNGIRVAGPFNPSWAVGRQPRLVLFDGEGLGHTPKSSSAVSTAVTRRIERADAVLLVDSAAQPMQAAPVAAMREIVATGNARKLAFAFTHFDEVKGDNLPTASEKAQHVLASAENVFAAIGEELGPFAERALRTRLETARVFLAGIDQPLDGKSPSTRRTIKQLNTLLSVFDDAVDRPDPGDTRPIYDRMNLVLAVKSAAEHFHGIWFPRLGLNQRPGVMKEHWTRIKALARRLATGMADEYDSLRPVADLRKELVDRIYVFVQSPIAWTGQEPSDDEKQAIYDALADNIGRRMLSLSTERVWKHRGQEWQAAYDKRGTGSTYVRAHIIGEQIYIPAAPIPDSTPSPDRNEFLRQVTREVEQAAEDVGARLR